MTNRLELISLINVIILMVNVGVLGLTLKLYTEYFKDRSQSQRAEPKS